MNALNQPLAAVDPELFFFLRKEAHRQEAHIELIASENHTSRAVMEAQGSVLTNKYAEGYPGKRYYGGCEHVDDVERLALSRVRRLFGSPCANVQPHSGSQANQAVFLAVLKPGDTILGMSLSDGGHLTHGSPVNQSGKWFRPVSYGLDANELLDYEDLERKAELHRPKLIIAGASAYSRAIDFERIGLVAKSIGAYFLVDMAHYAGLIAAGLYPDPVPHADFVTSTTHKTLRGPRGGLILMREEHEKAINRAVFPGLQGGPLMHVVAGKAVAFGEALQPSFKDYQGQVLANARALAEVFAQSAVRVVSGGTDSHVLLLDLRETGLTGKEAEEILGDVGVTVNKNSIPGDPRSPGLTSGIRIGTPAITTRGMGASQARDLASWVVALLGEPASAPVRERVRSKVKALAESFPVYTRPVS
jgi:glycine hydroxymethyltransferase